MPNEVDPGTSSSFHLFEVLLDSAEDAHPGSKMFYNAIIEAALLHAQKQRDYGLSTDPFANVRSSQEWGVPGWVGCMIRANDKIRRLQTFSKTGVLANEGVRDSFLDLAVYALIGLVLYEEESEVSLGSDVLTAPGVALSLSESLIGVSAPSMTRSSSSALHRAAVAEKRQFVTSCSTEETPHGMV